MRISSVIGTTLTAALLWICVSASTAGAETTLERVHRTGVIAIANTGDYPPMGFMQNGELVGFDHDFGEELAKRMGVKAQWVIVDFKGVIASIKSGRADLLISATQVSDDRRAQVAFTDPYMDFGLGAAYRIGTPIKTPADTKGLVLGLEAGAPAVFWARDNVKDVKETKLYDKLGFAQRDLELGRIDFIVASLVGLHYQLKDKPGIAFTDTWDSRVAAVGARLEDTDLVAEVNKHIMDMKKEGFFDQLKLKWFGY